MAMEMFRVSVRELADHDTIVCDACGVSQACRSIGRYEDSGEYADMVYGLVEDFKRTHHVGGCHEECVYCDGVELPGLPHMRVQYCQSGWQVDDESDADEACFWCDDICMVSMIRNPRSGLWRIEESDCDQDIWKDVPSRMKLMRFGRVGYAKDMVKGFGWCFG